LPSAKVRHCLHDQNFLHGILKAQAHHLQSRERGLGVSAGREYL
jgi:hypothetical protein